MYLSTEISACNRNKLRARNLAGLNILHTEGVHYVQADAVPECLCLPHSQDYEHIADGGRHREDGLNQRVNFVCDGALHILCRIHGAGVAHGVLISFLL